MEKNMANVGTNMANMEKYIANIETNVANVEKDMANMETTMEIMELNRQLFVVHHSKNSLWLTIYLASAVSTMILILGLCLVFKR